MCLPTKSCVHLYTLAIKGCLGLKHIFSNTQRQEMPAMFRGAVKAQG